MGGGLMNRKIKFRGKTKDGKWVYGYLVKGENAYILTEEQIYSMVVTMPNRFNENHMSVGCYQVIPETVGQCTGLKDINGIEIYEGDYVEHDVEINFAWETFEMCEIIYDKDYGMFCFYNDDTLLSDFKNLKIVGNIHEEEI